MSTSQDEIVISGISGRFPESDSMGEFAQNLLAGVDMVTDDDRRWPVGLYNLPHGSGKIKHLEKFDSQFFGVHGKQTNSMDPQIRMLLELTYEAIVDAGIAPQTLRGRPIGVFIGTAISETEEALSNDLANLLGYVVTGCSKSMFANRISYTFDLKGPSLTLDTACSSSMAAIHQAFRAIKSGLCEAAVVGGSHICIRPSTALQFDRMSMLSPDARCKVFDARANGYARSEACSVVFIQKASAARRVYATIVNCNTNTDGYKEEGITFPSSQMQTQLIQDTYRECNLDPLEVTYVEAHGTGTKVGDPQEIKALANVFCKGRKGPLLIGGVKSNMGHSEAASGLCSLAKVIIAFERQMIPANLHLNQFNPEIEPLVKGLVKPVTQNTPYPGGTAAISSFGFGGSNLHLIIKSNEKKVNEESLNVLPSTHPRLVTMCGRTEEAVAHVFQFIRDNPSEATREFLSLINEVSKIDITTGINYRGYTFVGQEESRQSICQTTRKRPVWLVFSGMGSQWPAMAKQLMQFPPFAQSIHSCAQVLKEFDVDLVKILTSDDAQLLNPILPCFVSIAAVQIALVDLINTLGIEADGIVGHSVGEIGCAYADGAFDLRQMILSAYWRGKCVEMAGLKGGLMAAVGLSIEECNRRLPKGVIAACHNSEDSVTISGPVDQVREFVKQLTAENVFAREVASCGVAFHSPYVASIAPDLTERLEKVIPHPKRRSSKWISSSVPQSDWDKERARFASAGYYVTNLISPVLFADAIKHVPKDALVIEVAPHSLLQAIVKRSLGPEATYVSFMKRNCNDSMQFLFESIGKLYNLGINLKLENLYPKVQYPVPKGTASISSLVKWDHSQSWLVPMFPEYFNPANSANDLATSVDLSDAQDEYLVGHTIDGRVLYPATGYLMLAWKAFAESRNVFWYNLPVEFSEVTFHRACILPKSGSIKLVTQLMSSTGSFTIVEGETQVATGHISCLSDQWTVEPGEGKEKRHLVLSQQDVYKELRIRGYDYGPTFQGIDSSSHDGCEAILKWTGNWVPFADAMLQQSLLSVASRALFLPVGLLSLKCNPNQFLSAVTDSCEVKCCFDRLTNRISTYGLELKGLKISPVPRKQDLPSALECYSFIPHHENDAMSQADREEVEEYVSQCSTIAARILEKADRKKEAASMLAACRGASRKALSQTLERMRDDQVVLKALTELNESVEITASNLQDNLTRVSKKYHEELEMDLLNQSLTRERFFRPLIDLVLANTFSESLDILEFTQTRKPLAPVVFEYTSMNQKSLNYSILSDKSIDPSQSSGARVIQVDGQISSVDLSPQNLVIYCDEFSPSKNGPRENGHEKLFNKICSTVTDGGFIIAFSRSSLTPVEKLLVDSHEQKGKVKTLLDTALTCGFVTIAKKSNSVGVSALVLRKVAPSSPSVRAINLSAFSFDWVDQVKAAMAEEEKKTIWLLSRDAFSGILGLINCLKREPGGERIRCIFDRSGKPSASTDSFDSLYRQIIQLDLVTNVIDANNNLGSYCHLAVEAKTLVRAKHAYLSVATRGDISSLKWTESDHKFWTPKTKSNPNEQIVSIYYAPLNFKDIMLATGKLQGDGTFDASPPLGLEFSGRDADGQRVMGILAGKGLATTCLIKDPQFLWKVPDHWSLEEASTVPVVYATCYYALIIRGSLQPGESVLIHSGTGGIGLAAIHICLAMKCKVFATVGSDVKRKYLLEQFPQLSECDISNSRDISFEEHILHSTEGTGVDLVLNSLAEEKLRASVRVLAKHGRFLEIGKFDMEQNNPLGMSQFLKNISFHGIHLDALFDMGNGDSVTAKAHRRIISQLLEEGIKNGTVKPLKRTIFAMEEAEQAFRFMMSGKHMGKVVLKIRGEESDALSRPPEMEVDAVARTIFYPSKSYIIIGGLGGFGLELAHWMVQRGAKKLILTSRSGIKDPFQKYSVERLETMGAQVTTSKLDVSKLGEAKKLIEEASKVAPVGGVFNLALVLRDSLFVNQTSESFEQVALPKAHATANLDQVTREICQELDHFVVFSSVSCGYGNAGQSNYGLANSVMERICEERRRADLPALAIQWGAIGDVGVIADKISPGTVIGGSVPQRINSCLIVLDQFLSSKAAVTCSLVRAEKDGGRKNISGGKDGLIAAVGHILGVKDAHSISPTITLSDLGMDSLMGVEIKQTLEREYDFNLSMTELRSLTIGQLRKISGSKTDQSGESATEQADKTFVTLPSLEIPVEPIERLNKVTTGKPIFILPPIEGSFTLIGPLADKINRPLIGISWTRDFLEQESIEKVAQVAMKVIKSIEPQGPHDIMGYSYGAIVAFEISLKCRVDNLFLLDSAPRQTRLWMDSYLESLDIEEPRLRTLVAVLTQLTKVKKDEVAQKLQQASNERERKLKALDIIAAKKEFSCDISQLEYACQVFDQKVSILCKYKPNGKTSSKVTLWRAEKQLFEKNLVEEDYGLCHDCEGALSVEILRGDHRSVISSNIDKIAQTLNRTN